MAKKRIIKKSAAVRCEHPDGGTFYILPMTFDQGAKYVELITKEGFERDDNGSILFSPKDGRVLKRYAADSQELISFSLELLDRVEDFEFEEGVEVEMSDENLRQVLTLMGTDDVEYEVELDQYGKEFTGAEGQKKSGKGKISKPTKENLFYWVTRKSALLAAQLNEVQKGN